MSASDQFFVMAKEQFLSGAFWKFSSRSTGHERMSSRFFLARNAIYYALKALQVTPGAHVLVPAYVCKAAVEPIQYFGARVEFYDVGPNAEPDFGEIVAKINSRTEAILAVHYFGFAQKIEQFRAICDRHGLALIEDCAHVLCGEEGNGNVGSLGDASVYSWRKFLPVYDGGELQLRHKRTPIEIEFQRESVVLTLKLIKSLVDQALEESNTFLAKSFYQLAESGAAFLRWLRGGPLGRPLIAVDSNDATFDVSLLNQPMSRVSRLLLGFADLAAIAERRRENFDALHERLSSLDGVTPLHSVRPSNVCPWVYPLILDGLPNVHLSLRREGIPAVTWGGVRPAGIDPMVFPGADFLFANLVFLPVHQNLTQESLDLIAEKVRKVRQAMATSARSGVGTHA